MIATTSSAAAWTAIKQANVEALRARFCSRKRDNKPTPEEVVALRRWAGWVQMQRLFAPDGPEALLRSVRALVTPSELDAGSRYAAVNAHWTPPEVAADVWTAVTTFGATSGARTVLEPSCGIGEFLFPAPQTVKMTGIEIDPATADIACLLFPAADVHTGSFGNVDLPDAHYELSVGNVPFSQEISTDQKYNAHRLPIAEHFLLKATRVVRPGGLVALIVPRRLLDARDSSVRERMTEFASLVAAVRFPSHRSGVLDVPGVVADLVILRRRSPGSNPVSQEPAWTIAAAIRGSSIQINEYFTHHPDQVLGVFIASGNCMKVVTDSEEPHIRLPRILADTLRAERTRG
ncbi:class I SAM-dependent methyltransferase [Auritidibacter ignavus]|uniref:Class I SAM-dependent methyltransferase n=1 Tax=Auritidibacter ignavus TaxID=678932 RepID=A0AAJ6APP5_9MICC|nr:class I SAM-dependent methyltransferase [Auritidibacter ignavus]WGH93549.1 class I SAM-dependent methyltransferase [Auritidibacter ignavus]